MCYACHVANIVQPFCKGQGSMASPQIHTTCGRIMLFWHYRIGAVSVCTVLGVGVGGGGGFHVHEKVHGADSTPPPANTCFRWCYRVPLLWSDRMQLHCRAADVAAAAASLQMLCCTAAVMHSPKGLVVEVRLGMLEVIVIATTGLAAASTAPPCPPPPPTSPCLLPHLCFSLSALLTLECVTLW